MANQQSLGNDAYDPEATEALRNVLNHPRLNVLRMVDPIKREIRRGADPHLLLENLKQPFSTHIIPFEEFAKLGEADFLQELFAMGLEPTPKMLFYALIGTFIPVEKQIQTANAILDQSPELIHAKDVGTGNTPLIMAIQGKLPDDFIESLLKRGANLDLQTDSGTTALMLAVKLRKSLVELLLRYGADVDLQNKAGRTARNHTRVANIQELLGNRQGGKRKTRRLKRKKSKTSKRR